MTLLLILSVHIRQHPVDEKCVFKWQMYLSLILLPEPSCDAAVAAGQWIAGSVSSNKIHWRQQYFKVNTMKGWGCCRPVTDKQLLAAAAFDLIWDRWTVCVADAQGDQLIRSWFNLELHSAFLHVAKPFPEAVIPTHDESPSLTFRNETTH